MKFTDEYRCVHIAHWEGRQVHYDTESAGCVNLCPHH